MYIVKNSYKSIVRAKGRNLLIFILVFLIAASPLALSASGSPSALPSLRSPTASVRVCYYFQNHCDLLLQITCFYCILLYILLYIIGKRKKRDLCETIFLSGLSLDPVALCLWRDCRGHLLPPRCGKRGGILHGGNRGQQCV